MYLTWLDSNSWAIELGGKYILLDPWLVGSLSFGNQNWFFRGYREQERSIPEHIDLILLSQGLPDHAHPPTLERLDRSIPVVGSTSAAKVVRDLGYSQVTALTPGETLVFDNAVEIRAVPGSALGPNNIENGYILKELATGLTIYYEPHGSHHPSLSEFAPVDVAIAPIIDLSLPLVGPIIKGTDGALKMVKQLQPQVILPTADPGEVSYEGLLTNLLKAVGTVEEFQELLKQNHLSTQAIAPRPGERLELKLQLREASTVS
ncbi:MAG: MBL fold metallo-hydrolase [Cyanosarcina radialis HA8281-LM2]|jgi:L-ascorbate metabolism protein UlaG (beta-lactamase superfamily)|nr:MBL fold metallo-hydrolase [Cyanosarcina radialis HA8281-LM2]